MSTAIGLTLDFDLTRGSRVWNEDDIHVPTIPDSGRVVPNINDLVYKYEGTSLYLKRVTEVDLTTYASTLVILNVFHNVEEEEIRDVILLGAPGRASMARRIYVDRSTRPITASVDIRFWFAGSLTRNIRIFRGTNINDPSKVISVTYDQSNNVLGEMIPLKPVLTVDVPNEGSALAHGATIKIAEVGHLLQEVNDNEILTVVAYNDQGGVALVQEMVAYNTHFARRIDVSRRFVTDIRLKSTFLSEQDSRLLQVPRLVTLESILLEAEVVYSNGEVREVPIDGDRCVVHGTFSQRYISNRDGHVADLVLVYNFDENEFLYGASLGESAHISRRYQVETTPFEAVFSARIWVVPTWHGTLQGYQLRYYLSTVRRDSLIDVTSKVRLSPVSPIFDGRLHNTRQELVLTLDMNEVSPSFQRWKFIQPVDVVLHGAPHMPGTAWTVNYLPGGNSVFGLQNVARADYISAGNWKLMIDQGEPSQAAWLDRMYRSTLPIANPELETNAPEPTHFRVALQGGIASEYSISEWNTWLDVQGMPEPGSTVTVAFIKRSGNGDLELGIVGIPFRQED